MNFKDSPEEAAFRAEVRSFLDAHARRKNPEEEGVNNILANEDSGDYVERAKAWQKTLYDNGWAAITWPKQYGGQDASPIQAVVFNQELAGYDVPVGVYTIGLGMIGPTIMTHGTEEQKQQYLPKMLEGSEIWCQLWSEPNAGSDVASLQTRAERMDDGTFLLNGQKVWTTGAHYCKWGLIIARTDLDVPKHRGISAFIVDMTAPGVEVRPIRQINGASGFNEVFFSDVRVPAENLVGDLNDGWRVALTTLMNERYAIGVGGARQNATSPLVKLAKKTDLGGRPATDDEVIRQQIAEAYIQGKLLWLTGARSITKVAKGGIPGPEGSCMKMAGTKLATMMGDVAQHILGLRGNIVSKDGPDEGAWAVAFLSAPGIHLAGGTDEIMKNIIGERVLGLPKEPQVDKEMPYRELRVGTVR